MNAPAVLSPQVRAADLAQEADRLDGFVRTAEDGTPFHLPCWLKAVEKGCGQRAHMLLAEKSGNLTGLLPLTEVRSRLFGKALVSSGFAVGGGILAEDHASATALAEAAWKLAGRLGCPEVELRGGPVPEDWDRREGVYANFARPLGEDEEAELKLVPRKQRAEIRKALKNDLAVDSGSGPRDRDAHYTVYATSVRNLGTPVFPRALFEAVLNEFGENADILTVRHQGRPVASVLNLYFGGTVMPYWGGGTFEARALRANELMYFALMNRARERGCTAFDFGRSKLGTGPFHYKKNWGFAPEPLVYAGRTAEGVSAREINPSSPKYRFQVGLWKRLPLPIANRIGPLLSRGIG